MKRNDVLKGIAWSLYAASWFLTVFPEDGMIGRIQGWQAFLWALSDDESLGLGWKILYKSSALTNIIPVVSLLTLGSRFRRLSSTLSWAFLSAGILNAAWVLILWRGLSDVREGYYVWWASFFLMAIAFRPGRTRTPSHNRPRTLVPVERTSQ